MFLGKTGVQALLLFVLSAMCLLADVDSAYAQSRQCRQLANALQQFERNGDFRQMGGNSNAARQLQSQVQAAESRYIREGCNDDAKAGRQLSRQCQQIGQSVLQLREDYAAVSQSVDAANAVAGQREAILQEMARFGCAYDSGSSATFSNDRQSVFDRVFGTTTEGDFTNGQFVNGGDYWGYQGYNTVRTVCVRLSDGYFWPISYATLPDYVINDAQTCQASCPTTPVELYFYDNPGQEPEQMRNVYGEPYTSLQSAFRYRTELDTSPSASCKVAPQSDGTISVAARDDGSSRKMLDVMGQSFPMPLRDPRGALPVAAAEQPIPAQAVANLVSVPLPRPRPAGPGETPVTRPASQVAEDNQIRLVQFGNKVVRVVGPDTPYAQPAEAGT